MYPNPRDCFEYLGDHLLKLRGTISDEEMRHPTMLDKKGQHCVMEIKNGSTTGVTIGRANALMSFVRTSGSSLASSNQTSKVWAICSYIHKSGVTPISFLLKSIKADGFPNAYLKACPKVA